MNEIYVVGASGARFEVLSEAERDYWNHARDKYLDQYKFENVSDLQDLDKVLVGEVLSFRWGSWLTREADYDGRSIEEQEDKLKKQKRELDQETRILKEKMGLNRAHRQDSEQQNVADYLETLLKRAKEFGVHRDHQIAKAIDLLHEIFTQVGLYYRTDEEERAHLRVQPEDIMQWLLDVAKPEFEAIDDAFRKNQTLWIKDVT
jgi:hypothetical protein